VADLIGFVGLVTVNAEAVLLRVNGDGAQVQLGAGRKMRTAISLRLAAINFLIERIAGGAAGGAGVWVVGIKRETRDLEGNA